MAAIRSNRELFTRDNFYKTKRGEVSLANKISGHAGAETLVLHSEYYSGKHQILIFT